MQHLTGPDIRRLRQRLGWSLAEMARQMGCTTGLVSQWEAGSSFPEPESLNQLRYLLGYVETNSEHIRQQPVVDVRIQSEHLAQLTHRDLLKDN